MIKSTSISRHLSTRRKTLVRGVGKVGGLQISVGAHVSSFGEDQTSLALEGIEESSAQDVLLNFPLYVIPVYTRVSRRALLSYRSAPRIIRELMQGRRTDYRRGHLTCI